MTTINHFAQLNRDVVTGIYRVTAGTAVDWNPRFNGQRTRVEIGDCTGKAHLLMGPETLDLALQANQIIQAIVRPKALDFVMGGTLVYANLLAADSIENLPSVIPLACCPPSARDALAELVRLWDLFGQPALKQCLSRAFDAHYAGFLNAQGGWQHHHEYPGGLLVHSVSTAQETLRQAQRAYPADPDRVQVIVAAALLHDFGKARQIVRGANNPVVRLIPHEYLSLQMLSEELERLGREWPEGGQLLASILYWLSRPLRERPRGHDVELVHHADVIDVKADRLHRLTPPLTPPRRALEAQP